MLKRTNTIVVLVMSFCAMWAVGGALAAQSTAPSSRAASPAVMTRAAAPTQRVNINTANAETLAKMLKGVGLKKAQAIVAFRQKNGPFKSMAELGQVKGIGDATIKKNAGVISLR